MKQKLFSVTIADCKVETFTVGGHGGSGKDTSNTGVRITHPPSGAVGTGKDERSQLANKRNAFRRMAQSDAFKKWVKLEAARRDGQKSIEEQVEEAMAEHNLRVEFRNSDGQWTYYE